jgi:hypothetical protein
MRLKVGHVEAGQLETLSERIGDAIFLLAEDFGDDENVVEEEDFALVEAGPFPSPGVGHFVEAAIADEPSVGQHQVGLLAHDALLDFEHLSHVIGARLELGRLDSFVNAHENFLIHVGTFIDPPQVLDEILQLHPLISWAKVKK